MRLFKIPRQCETKQSFAWLAFCDFSVSTFIRENGAAIPVIYG